MNNAPLTVGRSVHARESEKFMARGSAPGFPELREQREKILFSSLFGSIQLKDLNCSPFTVVRLLAVRAFGRRIVCGRAIRIRCCSGRLALGN